MIPAFVKELGSTSNKTAGTTLALTTTGTVAAGNLIVARILFDNAATASKPIVSSITKQAGETNNWVFLGAARSTSTSAGAESSGEMWAIQTTVQWAAAAYTVTLDSSVTMKAIMMTEFSGTQAVLSGTVGTAYSATTTAASAANGSPWAAGDLAVGLIFGSNVAAAQAGSSNTTGGTWSTPVGFGSTGGNVATNNFGIGQHKVLTSSLQQTYANQAAMTAGNGAIVAELKAIPDPSITQAAYRLYADGTESGSTALANQDTAPSVDVTAGDVNLQLRTRLQVTANAGFATDDYQLQWEKNASGTWTSISTGVIAEATDISATSFQGYSTTYQLLGESFQGDGRPLGQVMLYLGKSGSPTGNVTARLYAHTGTYGSGTGLGTGSPLAESAAIAATSLPTSTNWITFTFDGSFTLTNGTPYVIGAWWTQAGGNASNYPASAFASSIWAGTGEFLQFSGTWSGAAANDFPFRVFAPVGTVAPYDSANLTDGAVTTNRLGAGTGSFVAGKVSEDGLVDDLAIPASSYSELLYSLTLKRADLANGDTLRFRVLRNGVTTGLTYTQTPTINVTKTGTPGRPKIYGGSAFAQKPLKVWSGSAFVEKPVKVWTGSTWKTLT